MSGSEAAPANRTDLAVRLESLLGPLFRDPKARETRARVLTDTPELTPDDRAILAALDTVIDGLVARSRPRTGASARPRGVSPVSAPPPVPPVIAPPPPVPPSEQPAETDGPGDPRHPNRQSTRPVPGRDDEPPPTYAPIAADDPATRLLYDDVLNLSSINDWDAAFISIERMLVMSRVEGHVLDFVKSNEDHLLGLYEPALKSFGRVPKRRDKRIENMMHRVFTGNTKIAEVLAMVDRKLSIKKMFAASELSRLEVCATLVVLQRAGVIEI